MSDTWADKKDAIVTMPKILQKIWFTITIWKEWKKSLHYNTIMILFLQFLNILHVPKRQLSLTKLAAIFLKNSLIPNYLKRWKTKEQAVLVHGDCSEVDPQRTTSVLMNSKKSTIVLPLLKMISLHHLCGFSSPTPIKAKNSSVPHLSPECTVII